MATKKGPSGSPNNMRAPGQVRRSQMLTSYGPGAMVDLPDHAVIIGGLEFWTGPKQSVHEERLQQKLAAMFQRKSVDLFAPPVAEQTDDAAAGVKVLRFPQWFVAQHEERWGENREFRSRPLLHAKALVGGQYRTADKKSVSVLPMRFVQACPNGHISDVNWRAFAHRADAAGPASAPCYRPLWLDERGTTGDFADVFVRCECGKSRSLAETTASKERPAPLGWCDGHRVWLGAHAREVCSTENGKPYPNRLLVRSASNAYFSQTLSVIHIPEKDAALKKAIDAVWVDFLLPVEDEIELKFVMKQQKVFAAIGSQPLDRVLAEIKRRKSGTVGDNKSIKEAELEALLDQPLELSEDVPKDDFYAVTLPPKKEPKHLAAVMDKVEKVVLVHKLREVIAQVGFTRFDSITTDIDGELSLDVRTAPLALDQTWFPAVENHGEGVFIAFKKSALSTWWKRPAVKARAKSLVAGFEPWKKAKKSSMEFPGPAYVMLHSLSHLLITAVALECGYSASSIRERIYVGKAGAGILLFTGSADADGTLGGLVQLGRNIGFHLARALDLGRLCSNDPVCAQHQPDDNREERFLHGAACHGCVLIAEPSCERQNQFLDRALVVPTVDEQGAAFFAETP